MGSTLREAATLTFCLRASTRVKTLLKLLLTRWGVEPYVFLPPEKSGSNPRKKGGRFYMPEVSVRKGEPIDRALKRLKSKMESEGIMEEVRRLRAFETPTQKTKRKAKANAKRAKAKQRFNAS